MTDGHQHDWQRLAREMASSFTPERADAVKRVLVREHRAQTTRRRAAVGIAGVGLLGAVTWTAVFALPSPSFSPAPSPSEAAVTAASGDEGEATAACAAVNSHAEAAPRAVALSAGTRFSVEETHSSSTYLIERGIVRFETREQHVKKLLVRVGDLVIEDIGTIFTVEALADTTTRVSVTEGRVQVSWPSGSMELSAGSEQLFPLVSGAIPPREERKTRLPGHGGAEDWRAAARKGENRRALALIDADPSLVRFQADDLLLAADVMRLTGNPRRAVAYLERVVDRFPRDRRSASAAFSLGKVFLDELGKPRRAASAFAMAAREDSPLAEEASAREVEAWARAEEPERARRAALRYLQKYPRGARAEAVMTLGRIAP